MRRQAGGGRVVELIPQLRAETVAANIERVREQLAAAVARSPVARPASAGEVQVLAAIKYVSVSDLPALAAGGVRPGGGEPAPGPPGKGAAPGAPFEGDLLRPLPSPRRPPV